MAVQGVEPCFPAYETGGLAVIRHRQNAFPLTVVHLVDFARLNKSGMKLTMAATTQQDTFLHFLPYSGPACCGQLSSRQMEALLSRVNVMEVQNRRSSHPFIITALPTGCPHRLINPIHSPCDIPPIIAGSTILLFLGPEELATAWAGFIFRSLLQLLGVMSPEGGTGQAVFPATQVPLLSV